MERRQLATMEPEDQAEQARWVFWDDAYAIVFYASAGISTMAPRPAARLRG